MFPLITYPAPPSEIPSPDYTLTVQSRPVFVYQARVRAEIVQNTGLWTHAVDPKGERASFVIFDVAGPVEAELRPVRPFTTATVLPARAGIVPVVRDGTISFTVKQPGHLTVLLDGSDRQPLHLFIGAPETEAPQADDPNVIYFGPGVHEIETLTVRSGQTVYLAGGAVVKARLKPGETGVYNEKWKVSFIRGIVLEVRDASHVRICGRGILDAALIPHPGRNMILLEHAHDIHISGITLRDAANWNVKIRQSHDVTVDDLRIISGRLNSDGINSVNSQRVQIRRCFVRNHDDSIVAKTVEPEIPTEDITVEDCQVWDDWGYGLGATYETRAPIRRVAFRRCDILYARHWCLGIRVSDSAVISEITFTDIGIADQSFTPNLGGAHNALTRGTQLLNCVIAGDVWGKDPDRGHIRDITLDGIALTGPMLPSELRGADAAHGIDHILYRNITLNGKKITDVEGLKLNIGRGVRGVRVE